jgi:ABC-type sugar transport system substrate-binding protein
MRRSILLLVIVLGTCAFAATGESATGQRPLRVGYVVHVGQTPNPDDLFGRPYAAFIRAVKTFGVEGRVLQVPPNQDGQSVLTFLARQKYDLVIMGLPDPSAVGVVACSHTQFRMAARVRLRGCAGIGIR